MIRRFLAATLAALLSLALLLLPQLLGGAPLFAGADSYLFYARSASSQAVICSASAAEAGAVRASLADRTGESAFYADAADAFAQAERYGAALLFTERAGDVVNYYYRAPALGGGVWLDGRRVNLHVAVRGESAAVGTPLIFGGY